jgi:hypothetical protein
MGKLYNLNESEKQRIRGLYNTNNSMILESNIVITNWLSPDERYVIFLDELYDIKNKTKIGDIWENFDNFKFFLRHSFSIAKNIPKLIQEATLRDIDTMVLTESNQNMVGLKPYVKELLKESWLDSAWEWTKQQGREAVQGVTDFTNKVASGLKKTYNYIKDSDWSKAFDIIKRGALYVARSIRSAMYKPIGIILDAILLATGIGKSVQVAVWAIIVGLDIYEMLSGNYEEPNIGFGWRLLGLGVDIIGLVVSASAAKLAKAPITGLMKNFGSTEKGLELAIKQNKALYNTANTIVKNSSKAEGIINRALTYLQTKSPKIYNFIKGPLSKIGDFIKRIFNYFSKILGAPGRAINKGLGGGKLGAGAQAAFNIGAPIVAFDIYGHHKQNMKYDEIASALAASDVQPVYDESQI